MSGEYNHRINRRLAYRYHLYLYYYYKQSALTMCKMEHMPFVTGEGWRLERRTPAAGALNYAQVRFTCCHQLASEHQSPGWNYSPISTDHLPTTRTSQYA